jgi:hypothetical protein
VQHAVDGLPETRSAGLESRVGRADGHASGEIGGDGGMKRAVAQQQEKSGIAWRWIIAPPSEREQRDLEQKYLPVSVSSDGPTDRSQALRVIV